MLFQKLWRATFERAGQRLSGGIRKPIHTANSGLNAAEAALHTTTRLAWVDNLRIVLTALVIAHHAGQAYGPTGGDWPIFNDERARLLGPFFSVNAAFFMGLFFLLAGAFVPGSLRQKGAPAFLRERLLRLGVPTVVLALALFGPIAYQSGGQGKSFWAFLLQDYLGGGQVQVGHLWFVVHLLIYSLGYTIWRGLRGTDLYVGEHPAPPSNGMILGYTLVLGLITALVRIEYPIDRWVRLFGLVPSEIAHLPQYLSLFVIGTLAARGDWLRRLPTATGMRWLAVGLAASALRYGYSLSGWPSVIAGGGLEWRSLVWSVWEATICVGLCVGFPVLFRERLTGHGRIARELAASSYGAYIIHVLPVVGLQFAVAAAPLPPLAKFAIVTAVGVPLSFLLAAGIRRIPGMKRVL